MGYRFTKVARPSSETYLYAAAVVNVLLPSLYMYTSVIQIKYICKLKILTSFLSFTAYEESQ